MFRKFSSRKLSLTSAACAVVATAGASALAQPEAPLGSAFTYQGNLSDAGTPVNGLADMRFSLWTAQAPGGVQIGATLEFSNAGIAIGPPVNVVGGLFTVELPFGVTPFDGQDVYLEIEVSVPSGGGAWTTLSPRQRLAATPYALQMRGLFADDALQVGVGETAPLSRLHVQGNDIGLTAGDLFNDDLVIEDGDAGLGIYSTDSGSRGSALHFGQFSAGVLDNKWSIFQNVNQDDLRFKWGPDANWTNNPTQMVLSGQQGGTLGLLNASGTETITLDGTVNGQISVRDGGGTLRAEIGTSPAELRLFSNSGATIARLWGDAGGDEGTLDLFSEEDGLGVRMYATPFGGGFIETYQADGDRAFRFEPTNLNSGALAWMYDRNEAVSLGLNADSGSAGGARIWLDNLAGANTVELRGGGNGNGGNVYVRNDFAETTVELRGDEGGQNSGFIGILNRTGNNNFNAVAMDALDSFGTGARMLMRCSDGSTTVELDGEDGGHGEIALWDCDGNRTFRVFRNTMTIYNDAGNATWSINGNGAKNAIVSTRSFGQRLVYTMESPEVWFEDVGSGRLQGGVARIELDPVFQETVTVNKQHPMKVFVTLTGDCRGVFVEKGADHFIVRELGGGKSNASFDYRVMAKRVGFEDTRLETYVEEPEVDSDAFLTPVAAEREPTVDGSETSEENPAVSEDG